MPIISIKDLEYEIESQLILSQISFDINQGDYIALVGPNGGGKSTLIKIILGLTTQTAGEIELYTKEIGYVPQNVSLFDGNFPLSVYETVSLGLEGGKGWFSFLNSSDKRRIDDTLKRASIYELKDKNLSQLSGGQRQRVMIARALVSSPKVLILDEPSTGVDIPSQKRFYEFLKSLNSQNSLTIIFITHDLGVIADDVTHVLALNQKLIFSGTAKEMLSCESVTELYGTKSHIVGHHCSSHG